MTKRLTHLLAVLTLVTLLGGTLPAQSREALRHQLSRVFSDPAFHRAWWAVSVHSVDQADILFELNAHKRVVPASNMKLVTALAALEELGQDFKFRTEVRAGGPISNGVLEGDLMVVGSGDPTLGARLSSPDPQDFEAGDPLALFRDWAGRLKKRGVRRISGGIVGDDSIFGATRLGEGWSWDDLPYGYSSEISGLQFNENVVLLTIVPGASPGVPPSIQMKPDTGYLRVVNQLETVNFWEEWDFRLERERPGEVKVRGTLAEGTSPYFRTVAVANPTLYFTTVLKEVLDQEGIEVGGEVRGRRLASVEQGGELLWTHESPELGSILEVFLKISQNLYGESLLRWLDPRPIEKSAEGGLRQVERKMTALGIPSDAYQLVDGSGLSRYNLLTADMVVRLLHHAHHQPYREAFAKMLPVAGLDGTIRGRLRGTSAENRVQAKTGTLSNVRALSGYVKTRDGETLAFSMIVNNYTQPRRSAEYLQDLALEYLANFSRKRDERYE